MCLLNFCYNMPSPKADALLLCSALEKTSKVPAIERAICCRAFGLLSLFDAHGVFKIVFLFFVFFRFLDNRTRRSMIGSYSYSTCINGHGCY